MTITFPCTKCGKQYRATPELSGKQIKCKDCGTLVRVPTPRGVHSESSLAAARSTPSPRPSTASLPPRGPSATPAGEEVRCPRCSAPSRIMPEWRGMTLECPSCKSRFTVPAASAPALPRDEEPQFHTEDADESAPSFFTEDEHDGTALPLRDEPVPAAPPKRKKKKSHSSFGNWSPGSAATTKIGAVVGAGALVAFGAVDPLGWLIVVVLGSLAYVVGAIWLLVVAFAESVLCGLMCLFVPFYGLYYLMSRWEDTKKPFLIAFSGWLIATGVTAVNPAGREALLAVDEPDAATAQFPGVPVAGGRGAPDLPPGFPNAGFQLQQVPDNHVQLRISGVPNEDVRGHVVNKLRGVAGAGSSVQWRAGSNPLEVTVWPVNDPAAFAKAIDFGKVKSVKGKIIEVDADPGLVATVPKTPDVTSIAKQLAAITERPRPSNPIELRKMLLEDLKSSNPHTRRVAAEELAKMKPDDQQAEVSKELAALLSATDAADDVLTVLRTWGDETCIPAVIRALRSSKWPSTRSKAMAVLAKFPSEQSASAIAESMELATGTEALALLFEMGPVAEKPIAKALKDLDPLTLNEALKTLRKLCDSRTPAPETVDAVLDVLRKERNPQALEAAIDFVAKVKEERVAVVLAGGLAETFHRQSVVTALVNMGTVAEKPVLEYLKHSDPSTRTAACEVLARIGTRRSIVALQPLVRDFFMGRAAKQAIDAIEARLKSKKD